ncbi:UNVERIFIED_CONTAM: Disease resistance RPP13-like protein 4 [Sesamum radiatum]|uniref:Disease resistance RPP13-like protein 4 n=1 Tax=Sesamum radiatum TaxID=300843 RepID=A0AAW2PIY9_SESRA
MIGFDEQLLRVMDELTGDEPNLQILPLVGMGGTSKTTLAINIFDHPYIVHFDKRIWLTISQEYSVHEILVRLLNDGTNQEVSEAKLGEQFYKSLFGERTGSRVMITTRLLNATDSLGSQKPYLMNFLDEDESWNLFCHKAFALDGCPYPELEEIGKDIAKACRGLPLTIVVIGGLLANSNMEQEYWKNLVLIRGWTNRGKPRVCGIHDLLRDLCLKEADKEKFIRTPKVQRIYADKGDGIVCFLCGDQVSLQETIDVPEIVVGSQLTLGASGLVCETLSFIHDFKCTKEVLHRTPNLKKLKIVYLNKVEDWSSYCLYNLVHLHKLESLYVRAKDLLLKNIVFPTSLKKLDLCECKVPWEDMKIIGSLPNLEVLILRSCASEGSEWNPIEGQFSRLKILTLWESNLVCWRAENIHFPNLEKLSLSYMYDLEEIPSGIGDIATLRLIHVYYCSESTVNSAKQIQEEQQSNGNEDLEVRVYVFRDS